MGKPKKRLSDETLIIAYRLREARANKFKTIKEAADALPAQKTLWSHWENAFVRPQDATIEKLADLLGVPVDFFRRKPEDWDAEKRRFLTELIGRTRVKKDYYNTFKASLRNTHDDGQMPPESKPKETDALGVFLQITGLIADAQNRVAQGEIDRETYQTHMRMIADMVKVSLFMGK
jgi:transcriptional regulator with XRE-family HTH domain